MKEFLFRLQTARLEPGSNPELDGFTGAAAAAFENSLDDDLNTAQALGSVFDLIRKCNTALSDGLLKQEDRKRILQFFDDVEGRLAVVPLMETIVQGDEEIESLIASRNEARRKGDFALADQIRQQLLDRGVVIEDTREGTKWRLK